MDKACAKCTPQKKSDKKWQASFLSSLFIIILPKCPFCIMAYSSVLTVCGGKSIYMSQNNWISYIPLGLSILVLYLLIKNFRDARTYVALGMAVVGSLMLILVHQLILPPQLYNLGAILLFFAIWLNGSFLSFVFNLKRWVKNRIIQWHT